MTEEQKGPEGTPRAGEVVRTVIERIGETIDATTKIARLSLDIGALNARRNGLLQEMGAKVYDLYGKGLVKNSALQSLSADVSGVDAQIAEKRAQIAELRGQKGQAAPGAVEPELGIEEEPVAGASRTMGEDLTDEEEREIRPPGERKL